MIVGQRVVFRRPIIVIAVTTIAPVEVCLKEECGVAFELRREALLAQLQRSTSGKISLGRLACRQAFSLEFRDVAFAP